MNVSSAPSRRGGGVATAAAKQEVHQFVAFGVYASVVKEEKMKMPTPFVYVLSM